MNVSSGKIVNGIHLDINETIMECLITNSHQKYIIIVTKNNTSKLNLHIFSNLHDTFTRLNTLSFLNENAYKLALNETSSVQGHLLIESSVPFSSLKLYTFDLLVNPNSYTKPKSPILLHLDFLNAALTTRGYSLLDNACLTANAKYLVMFINYHLYFVDLTLNRLISFKDFTQLDPTVEYFLSPTYIFANKLTCLSPLINRSNDLICLNNLNSLMSIRLDATSNKIKIRSASNYDQFESFKLNEKYLLAYNRLKSTLIGILITDVIGKDTFDKHVFKLKISHDGLKMYGFSSDLNHTYVFTLEHNKLLKVFRFADGKMLAEMLVPYETSQIVCTGEHICLAMKTGELLSYLICDPEIDIHMDKIKPIHSNDTSLGCIIKDYSSNEESDDNEIVEKLLNFQMKKFKKKQRSQLDTVKLCNKLCRNYRFILLE